VVSGTRRGSDRFRLQTKERIQVKNLIERLKVFFKEVRLEMSKVTWPTRAELKDSTIVVIVSCLVIAAFIGAVDYVLYSLVKLAF
jgi:preprotein translocase subunit SecE